MVEVVLQIMYNTRREGEVMFHEKIAFYRKKNMMTQEELAEHLCVSRQTITKWESGMISPSYPRLGMQIWRNIL